MASVAPSEDVSQTGATTPDIMDFLHHISAELSLVEQSLAAQVSSFQPGVSEYVTYVLSGTGKRLRPSLALLAGGASGKIRPEHITLGVIVELIHIATLVHDDILDGADFRRGLSTSNSRWGNEISVLLGDCLFARALQLTASYPTTAVCEKVSEATNVVCSGEILQTQKRYDLETTIEQYVHIIQMKTGALFAVSCELGAQLNGATDLVVEQLREFGANLGIAYQIYDDCVDIFGQEWKAGKSLGTDMKGGKLTLPVLLLLEMTSQEKRQTLEPIILGDSSINREELLVLLSENNIQTGCLNMINKYIAHAIANLKHVTGNTSTKTLTELANYLSAQSKTLLGVAGPA